MLQVTTRVPAKINMVLSVGPRRTDGFHDLVTVFHAVSLYDDVRAAPGDGLSLTVSGPYADATPADDANLAVRAARTLAEHARVPADAALDIHKAIPVAGGLAGGSADAAGALLACDELWGLGLSDAELAAVAAGLGSDVPFALAGGTAVGRGRGERLGPVDVGSSLSWVLAVADGGLPTPAVYAQLDADRAGEPIAEPNVDDAVLDALVAGDPVALGEQLRNDMQDAAIALRPALADTLRAGQHAGTLGAVVSGSGPTCAFLVRDDEHAAGLAAELTSSGTCAAAYPVTGGVATGG